MTLELVFALAPAQTDDLVALYDGEWWSQGRSRGDVARMLEHCVVVGLADGDGRLVGFARAVTDHVYKALVLDVIVAPARRGQGLGRRLMDALCAHPRLAGVRHLELYCRPEMAGFYERWAFTTGVGEIVLMRRTGP